MNILDVRTWKRDLINQTCQKNRNKYRTIRYKWNPFVESLKPNIFDPINGALSEEMKPIPFGALQRGAHLTNMTMFNSR